MKKSRSIVNTIREKHSRKETEISELSLYEKYSKNSYENNTSYSSDRKTESEIKRSELHYQFLNNLFQTIPCAIAHFSCSPTPKMKYCNRAAIVFCGFEDSSGYEQFLGVGFNRFIPTEWTTYVNDLFAQAIEQLEPIEFEYQMCKIDGSLIWISGVLQKSTLENEEPILQSVYMDITKQKKLLSQQGHTKGQIQELVDNIPAGVAIFEVTEKIRTIYINEGLCRLAGYETEEFKDLMSEDPWHSVHPDDTDTISIELQRCMVSNKSFDVNFRFLHKSQGFRWVNLQARMIEKNDDKVVFYAVYTDALRLNQTQQKFERTVDLNLTRESIGSVLDYAKKVNQAKQEFFAHISQEIYTPLNEVIGMLDLLENQEHLTGNEYLESANLSARDLAKVIHDTLAVFQST